LKKLFYKKKFILNQPIKEVDPKVELLVLEEMLTGLIKDENYEVAATAYNRIKSIKSDESQARSSSRDTL
jgi:protein-arginine kinase activator protein McsA